jgi:hypothetical protein
VTPEEIIEEWEQACAIAEYNPPSRLSINSLITVGGWMRDLLKEPPAPPQSARTGDLPQIIPCPHCADGAGDPTGVCCNRDCRTCVELRGFSEDSTCGRCGGMGSVTVRDNPHAPA